MSERKDVNPPHNAPKPLPAHQHDPAMSGWCPICQEAARQDRRNHPEKYVDRGRER